MACMPNVESSWEKKIKNKKIKSKLSHIEGTFLMSWNTHSSLKSQFPRDTCTVTLKANVN